MELLLKCRKFDVVRRQTPDRDGKLHTHEIILHPGAAVILPLLDAETCVMIRNTRPSIERELWELPAGTLDKEGESFAEAAARELEEETGYRAGRLEHLCAFYTSPGFLTEMLHAYVATDLKHSHQQLEDGERIIVEKVRLSEAVEMCLDGRIVDGKTMIALMHWELHRRMGK